MHGSVTGFTRRALFGADFVFVENSVKDWIGHQRRDDTLADSSDMVPYSSGNSSPAATPLDMQTAAVKP